MKTLVAVCVALSALTVRADEPKKQEFDPAKLVGTWKYAASVKGGEKAPAERLAGDVVITKDTITIPGGPDAKFVIAYKIDANASPVAIDLDIKDGPVKEGKALGIISMKDGEVTICYVPDMGGAKRPTKFESPKDSEARLITLKKK